MVVLRLAHPGHQHPLGLGEPLRHLVRLEEVALRLGALVDEHRVALVQLRLRHLEHVLRLVQLLLELRHLPRAAAVAVAVAMAVAVVAKGPPPAATAAVARGAGAGALPGVIAQARGGTEAARRRLLLALLLLVVAARDLGDGRVRELERDRDRRQHEGPRHQQLADPLHHVAAAVAAVEAARGRDLRETRRAANLQRRRRRRRRRREWRRWRRRRRPRRGRWRGRRPGRWRGRRRRWRLRDGGDRGGSRLLDGVGVVVDGDGDRRGVHFVESGRRVVRAAKRVGASEAGGGDEHDAARRHVERDGRRRDADLAAQPEREGAGGVEAGEVARDGGGVPQQVA